MTNYQIPQTALLKYRSPWEDGLQLWAATCGVRFFGQVGTLTVPGSCRFFYQFLLGNERATAKEIRDEYVETLSKIYLSYYRSYLGRLMKVQVRPWRENHSWCLG